MNESNHDFKTTHLILDAILEKQQRRAKIKRMVDDAILIDTCTGATTFVYAPGHKLTRETVIIKFLLRTGRIKSNPFPEIIG